MMDGQSDPHVGRAPDRLKWSGSREWKLKAKAASDDDVRDGDVSDGRRGHQWRQR